MAFVSVAKRGQKRQTEKKQETEYTILSEDKERTDWVVNFGKRKTN